MAVPPLSAARCPEFSAATRKISAASRPLAFSNQIGKHILDLATRKLQPATLWAQAVGNRKLGGNASCAYGQAS
jgi:hypothetical protein